jgi:hypothetical protein
MPLPVTRKLTLRGLGSINANAVYRAQLAQRWRVFLRALVIRHADGGAPTCGNKPLPPRTSVG